MPRVLLTAPLALALAACVGDSADSGLYILRNIAPDEGCVIDPSSEVFQTSGVIETDSPGDYFFTPVARNDLVTNGNDLSQKTIFVEGARVTIGYHDADLFTATEQAQQRTEGLTQFETLTSGSIEPDGGVASFGLYVVPTDLLAVIGERLPAPTVERPRSSTVLDVGVQLYGTQAGDEIVSNVFHFPVEVCRDCLVFNVGLCSDLPAGFVGGAGGVCNPYQDAVLQCCETATGQFVCPATSTAPET